MVAFLIPIYFYVRILCAVVVWIIWVGNRSSWLYWFAGCYWLGRCWRWRWCWCWCWRRCWLWFWFYRLFRRNIIFLFNNLYILILSLFFWYRLLVPCSKFQPSHVILLPTRWSRCQHPSRCKLYKDIILRINIYFLSKHYVLKYFCPLCYIHILALWLNHNIDVFIKSILLNFHKYIPCIFIFGLLGS